MDNDILCQPLRFRNLTVKNRIFRSSISGRFDNYDGSGTPARVNWEEKFARGGVGAIISSFVPVHVSGRILPNYATISADDRIPFWRAVGERTVRGTDRDMSAEDGAALTGGSRVTSRRDLDRLARSGLGAVTMRYGKAGRPEHRYRWTGATSAGGAEAAGHGSAEQFFYHT